MNTAITAVLAAVLLSGCCSLHQISTETEQGQRCHQVGIRCCPAEPMGG